jgi:hypothetical protein
MDPGQLAIVNGNATATSTGDGSGIGAASGSDGPSIVVTPIILRANVTAPSASA